MLSSLPVLGMVFAILAMVFMIFMIVRKKRK